MSERESYFYPHYDDSSLLFMSPESDSFPVGGGQDAQQWSPSIDDWELDVIPPSELPAPSPIFGELPYDENAFSLDNNMHNHIPSINIDTTVPLSHLNTHGLSSPNSSTPLTPGFVSPSQPGYSSSPSLLAVTPPTPALNLGNTHDTFPVFSPSTPVSPYGSQHPPWTIPKPNPSPEPEHFLPLSQFQRGPMVPQKRYKPHTSSDRRRYVDEVNLEPSIHFYMQKPDEEGIPLKDAMHGRFARLVSRDEPMFQERGPSISVRINWPGYQPWSRQIPTRDFRNPPGPITRAKLAKNVAKSVARFIQEHKGRQMEEDGDAAWLVGPGKIDVFDLVLVRLDHVSKGSWQAQLQLVRPRS
ncbi:hypothetical protein H4582DRAFT_1473697 [Lactarius indigo]|nr:hypothetical protein H4582DRAFT_1473697 [Lactarius indigo]